MLAMRFAARSASPRSRGVTAARSQESLARANGKRDLDVSFNYSHVAGFNTGRFFFNMQLPIFDRNQGEIARTNYAITQSQELFSEAIRTGDVGRRERLRRRPHQRSDRGALPVAAISTRPRESRDISQYAYQRGAASLLDFLDAERSYRANQLAYRQALSNYMLAARASAPGRGNQESAMRLARIRSYLARSGPGSGVEPGGLRLSRRREHSQMTSYTARETKAETAELFTRSQGPDGAPADDAGCESAACRECCGSPARWPTTLSPPRRSSPPWAARCGRSW